MHKLLIVDDEPDITSSLGMGLTKHGFTVEMYNNPTEALKEFEPRKYDLALLDFKMPEMNGYDLFHELTKLDNEIKVCFLSAHETPFLEFQKLFPDLPHQCFIRKPITLRSLVDHIELELKKNR